MQRMRVRREQRAASSSATDGGARQLNALPSQRVARVGNQRQMLDDEP